MPHVPARLVALLILSCGAQAASGQAPAAKPRPPTTIDAESIEGVSDLEVTARGRVEFQREDLTVYSEFLRFNQEFGRIEADGGVRLLRGVDRFFGPRLRYNTADDSGVFEEPTFVLRGELSTMRGGAERLEFLGRKRYRVTRGSFTTCEPGKEDWRLEARELELDRETEVGTLRDGRLRFLDTTLLALPYGSFSLDNQRKSGFLAPRYSQNTRRGAEVAVPYYWNIAPEQDLTLTPGVMTKRGTQLKTEYRYLGPTYRGEVRYEYMPNDRVIQEARSGFSLQHVYRGPRLFGQIDLNKVSDHRYFVDLASRVQQVSTGNLQQLAQLGYNGALAPGWSYSVSGQIQRFQTLQDPLAPITPPYHRVPQLNFSTGRADIGGRFDLVLPAELVRFSHPTLVEGTRFSLNPTLAAPLLAPGYFLTPKLGMRYAGYRLHQAAAGQPDRQSVTVPWLSVDGGLIFDRGVRWFGESLTQTLEPRLFYL
ncbi:MAG: LPS assembly protein LptD, partial [Pseudomonadota bacterium]